jgi:hypothetical protein
MAWGWEAAEEIDELIHGSRVGAGAQAFKLRCHSQLHFPET